jgi:hypothetical protein
VTPPKNTDEKIADFLIGDVDPSVWGWPAIDASFAHAYVFALGVASRNRSGAADDPTAAMQRGRRVRSIVAERWVKAAADHPDPGAQPSLRTS